MNDGTYHSRISWDEAFSQHYDQRSAGMTEDIDFYVELAEKADGPLVELDGVNQEEPVPHTVRYSVGNNRIDIVIDNGGKSSIWWATKNEWLALVDVAGLKVETLYGGFAGEPFGDESREYVFLATPKNSISIGTQRKE